MSATEILAVDPGVSGAAVEMCIERLPPSRSGGLLCHVWNVHSGKPDATDTLRWMRIGRQPFGLFVIERQNIRTGKDAAFMVATIAELHRTLGRWDVISEQVGFAENKVELGWNDIKALVVPFLATQRGWEHKGERVARVAKRPFPAKKTTSEMKRTAVEAVLRCVPQEQIEQHFLTRNDTFRDGPCDAFLLGLGAWLKESVVGQFEFVLPG